MMRSLTLVLTVLFGCLTAAPAVAQGEAGITRSPALAEFGEPLHGPDFAHFGYADPTAPKGGTLRLGAYGSWETLNSLPLAGEIPRSLPLLHDTLMVESQEQLSVFHGLIARTVEYPDDRSWIVFHLRPEARFHDGTPIRAEDIVFTFEAIREHARPFLRSFYEDVASVTAVDPLTVRFDFATTGTMKPLVTVAGMTVYPRHYWQQDGRSIAEGTTEIPLGSGPYRITEAEPGRFIRYGRVEDYWAADLPVRRGLFNFDTVIYDYYRDRTVMQEAFRAGAYDFRREFSSRNWATGYDFPAMEEGRALRRQFPVTEYRGLQGFFFNTRLPQFSDPRVRQALGLLYDFTWVNENVMFGLYEQIDSFFPGHEYASSGLPQGRELELLEPFRDQVPGEVFAEIFAPYPGEGTGRISREVRRRALALLEEAGWQIRDQVMVDVATGQPFTFEIMIRSSLFEPHTQPWIQNLAQLGISASIRLVDSAQFQERYQNREFDVTIFAFAFYPPPGGEMRSYFSSGAADEPAAANIIGIRDPVVDALLETIIAAESPEEKLAATHALDRVLLWGHYVVPHWYTTTAWIAWWDKFGFPDITGLIDYGFANSIQFQPSWWFDAARAAALEDAS